VFRILKLGVFLVLVAGLAWAGYTVPLGERTLFEHARAIGQTEASQELVDGTRQKVQEVKAEVGRKVFGGAGEKLASGKPAEELTAEDKRDMKRLLESMAE